jgi:type II secretory pathway pseudopilin PulG
MLKKGAMFGLDARIALAIFGALSVISGAALYSAIQDSKVTQIITQTEEIEKAISQYMLDVGNDMPLATSLHAGQDVYDLSAFALLEKPSGVNGWNGPYLPFVKDSAKDYIKLSDSSDIEIIVAYRKSGDWGSFNASDMNCQKADLTCHVWIAYTGYDLQIQQALEKRIDGTANPGTENFTGRFNYSGSYMHFKTDIPFPPSKSKNP